MPNRSSFLIHCRRAAVFLAASLIASSAVAQPARPGRQPPADRTFPARAAIDADVALLENELAGLLQFRGDMPADQAGRLELLIDLRVVARALLMHAARAEPESDAQACYLLRGEELTAAASTVAELFKNMPKPTPAQADAMAKLHALTFNLAEVKGVKATDDLCQSIGELLAAAAGPLEQRQLPIMRPAVAAKPATTNPSAPKPPAVDPLSRANLLTVSPALKRQVVALATAAQAADAANDRKESAALNGTLLRVLDASEALMANTATSPQARQELERKLAEGLGLFIDPRVRSVGQQRLSALDDYAQMLARVKRMNLKPDLYAKLAPLLARAGDDDLNGPKLMAAVEAYLKASARLDARAATPPAALPPRETKLVADAVKAATTARDQFLVDAGGKGLVDPSLLAGEAATMAQSLDAAESHERLPRATSTVLAYKPKPTGALDRRVAAALQAVAAPAATPAKDDAQKLLNEIVRLAELSAEYDPPAAAVPADVVRDYTRGQLAAFDARRRDLVAELAGQLSAPSTKELDSMKVEQLKQMKLVRAALVEAVAVEAAVAKGPLLARWVDWAVNPESVKAAVGPYRTAMGTAVAGYAAAVPAVPESWSTTHARYAPLVKLLVRAGASADGCAGFPQGLAGHVGRLMTPLDGQPYAAERFGGLAVRMWARYGQEGNDAAVKAVAEALGKRF